MDKVRFACPRCQTTMQTGAEKIGSDVACPHCAHRFRLVESESPTKPDLAIGIGPNEDLDSTFDHSGGLNVLASSAPDSTLAATALEPVATPQRPVGFQCPYCQTTRTPIVKSEVSQTGWLIFVVLLLTTCFGCIVGLFIRDNYRQCSQCKIRLG